MRIDRDMASLITKKTEMAEFKIIASVQDPRLSQGYPKGYVDKGDTWKLDGPHNMLQAVVAGVSARDWKQHISKCEWAVQDHPFQADAPYISNPKERLTHVFFKQDAKNRGKYVFQIIATDKDGKDFTATCEMYFDVYQDPYVDLTPITGYLTHHEEGCVELPIPEKGTLEIYRAEWRMWKPGPRSGYSWIENYRKAEEGSRYCYYGYPWNVRKHELKLMIMDVELHRYDYDFVVNIEKAKG